MELFHRGILDLLRVCLNGGSAKLPSDFDWKKACEVGSAHQILPILYYGAFQSELELPEEVKTFLERATFQSIFIDKKQMYALEELEKRFEEHGIEYLPLKGALLKYLYPKTEMRSMGDADVLIRMEQYEAIKPILRELGYEEILESDHELVWNKQGSLHLELHKRLIPSYNKDYYKYFGDGWKLAHRGEGSCYEMKKEDQFIYLFVHYAKHYRDAGIGIRHLTDLYVYQKANPDMDLKYVEKELDRLQLVTFYRNSMETAAVWFDGAVETEMTDFMTARIFGSGSYGTRENQKISEGLKVSKTISTEKVKRKKLMQLIFPSAKVLALKYTILAKLPILLPFVWVYRWIVALLFKRRTIEQQRHDIDLMSEERISNYQNELNYVGLDFNFEEKK